MIVSTQQKNKLLNRIIELESQLNSPSTPGIPETIVKAQEAQANESIALYRQEIQDYELALKETGTSPTL